MSFNNKCQYYRLETLKDDVLRGTLSPLQGSNTHRCLHPKNEEGIGQLDCNTSNDFCPYKRKKQ